MLQTPYQSNHHKRPLLTPLQVNHSTTTNTGRGIIQLPSISETFPDLFKNNNHHPTPPPSSYQKPKLIESLLPTSSPHHQYKSVFRHLPLPPHLTPYQHHHHHSDPYHQPPYHGRHHPDQSQKPRPRRRFEEVERLYSCRYPGCDKAYGALNHLNSHIVFKGHGPKRNPQEFGEMRRVLKLRHSNYFRQNQSQTQTPHQTNQYQGHHGGNRL